MDHATFSFMRRLLWVLVLAACATTTAHAQPTLRYQTDLGGNFVLIGNTLAQDCAAGVPAPVVGTIGECPERNGAAPDVYWRVDPDTGVATADVNNEVATDASSVAVLNLPDGAQVAYARLYWGGLAPATEADLDVRLLRLDGSLDETITTTETNTVLQPPGLANVFYISTADVTEIVAAAGPGPFLVTDVDSTLVIDAQITAVSIWYLVVFYELDGAPQRNLAIFDTLEYLDGLTAGLDTTSVTLSGFTVPSTGFDASLGVITFEGETQFSGDSLSFNNSVVSDALNPADNFFNASRSYFGTAVSEVGDLPQLSGQPGSLSNVDMDVVNVTSLVQPGDTSASITASSSIDRFLLSAFITSVATLVPDFSDSAKAATDEDGEVLQGDTLEYRIAVVNDGSDVAEQVVLRDPLPEGVTFVPGSLQILSGPNSGALTDEAGDDQAEFDAATRSVIFRLGAGATATAGGVMEIGDESEVSFEVTIDPDTLGTISNQGFITSVGRAGAPETETPTDSDSTTPGQSPTDVTVNECESNDQCSMDRPYCDTSGSPKVCVPCTDSSQCTDPTAPDCNLDTNTCECAAGPGQCEEDAGMPECVEDSDCGGPNSGSICEDGMCVPGCRGTDGSGCPSGEMCSSTSDMPGMCEPVPAPDAGVPDAGPPPDLGEFAGGGCDCAVGPQGSNGVRDNLALGGLALLWLWPRRRRRRCRRGSRA